MALPAPYHGYAYPLPWLYLPLTMAIPTPYHGHTYPLLWLQPPCNERVVGARLTTHCLLWRYAPLLPPHAPTPPHLPSPTPQQARGLRYLFHGAGSANLGSASLLINEAKVPQSQVARHVETRPPLLSPWLPILSQDGRLSFLRMAGFPNIGLPASLSRCRPPSDSIGWLALLCRGLFQRLTLS